MTENFINYPITFFVRPDFGHLAQMNRFIMQLRESGLLQKRHNDHRRNIMPNEDSNNIVEAEVLQLVHFIGHAVEIVGGLSLSIATFFAELYVHKKITKKVWVSNNKKGYFT